MVLGLTAAGVGCGRATKPGGPPVVQVVAVEAQNQEVVEALPLVGSVLANEMVEIQAETDGVIQEIYFREGERVPKAHLLVRLDESKSAAALAEAEANFNLSRTTFERSRQLFQEKLISQQEFDQAASAFEFNRASLELKRRQLKDARIYAPFAGVVGARNVSPGQVINKNTTLTWLVDLDPVKVEVYVPERFLSQLEPGQEIGFGVAAYPGRRFTGRVYFIAPQINPADRTALVKARVPNPDSVLVPGMFASLELTLTVRTNAVVIPEVALSQVLEGDRANVFVVDASQTVQVRQVELGVRLAGQVEVLRGLRGGEMVVVEGIQKIGPGLKVKFAPPEAARPYLPGGRSEAPADGIPPAEAARPKTDSQ